MRIFSAVNITKSYNGSQIRRLGHTTVTSYFETAESIKKTISMGYTRRNV